MNTLLALGLSNIAVATVLAALAWSAGRWLRRPALTHGLWLLVFLKLLTPPLFSIPVIRTSAPAPPVNIAVAPPPPPKVQAESPPVVPDAEPPGEKQSKADVAIKQEPAATPKGEPVAVEQKSPRAANDQQPFAAIPMVVKEQPAPAAQQPAAPIADLAWSFDWSWLPTALTWTWLTGAALWLALALVRLVRFQRLLRWGQSAPAELRQLARDVARRMDVSCPKLVLVPGTISPMLWVFGRKPRLVLPAALMERLSPEQWQTLLAHELAHWRRRDHWVRWLELAAMGLYWWCPLVWWAKQELQQAEEECCDAWVVTTLPGAAREYALALVETVDFLSGARAVLPPAASGLGHIHLLRRRLTMILRGRTPRALTLTGLAAVLMLGLLLLPLAPTLGQDAPPAAAAPAVQKDDKKDDKVPDREDTEKAKKDLKKLQDDFAKLQKDFAEKQQDLAKKIREAAQKAGVPIGPEFGGFPGIGPQPFAPGGLQPLQPGVGPGGLQPLQPGVGPGGLQPIPFGGPRGGDLERRLDDLERKLDKLIQKLGGDKAPGKGGEDRPRGGAEGREEAVQPAARNPGAPLNIQAPPAVEPKR